MTNYPADIMRDALQSYRYAPIGESVPETIARALLAERTRDAEIARAEAAHRGAGFGEWIYSKIMEGRNG